MIPEWQTLNEIEGATLIYKNLIEWAKSWHIHEDWCLYYALRVMRIWLFRESQRVPPSWSRADSGQWLDDSDMMIDALWDDLLFQSATDFYKSVYGSDLSKYGFFFDYAGVSFKGSSWNPFYDEVGE